jgi:hypothetical protein
MRLLQAPRQLLRHASSIDETARPESIELSARRGSAHMPSHHGSRLLTTRTSAAADPYAAWLKQREAEREREARHLNPRDAWDDLRLQGFCVIGR